MCSVVIASETKICSVTVFNGTAALSAQFCYFGVCSSFVFLSEDLLDLCLVLL